MFCLIFMELVSFPQRDDAIFEQLHEKGEVMSYASGSLGIYKDGKCQMTTPNMSLGKDDRRSDWCSNIAKKGEGEGKPWISYRVKNKRIKANGYAIRSGCCYYGCCCIDDSTYVDKDCCCSLFSYSLQVSDNNKTWKTIHRVEEDQNFWACTNRVYKFNQIEEFTYVRLLLDKQRPYCENCFALNRFEIYGQTTNDNGAYLSEGEDENDESVSIIGKVKRDY